MLKQLALNSNTYRGFTIEDAINGAKNAVFTQIELAAVDHTPHVLPNMDESELNKIKKMLENKGLTCVGIGAHSNLMEKEGVKHIINCLSLTTFFDCQYIITATGETHDDTDVIDDVNRLILLKNVEHILNKCESLGKTLLLETHGNNFATGVSLKKLAEKLNNRVKINYDTGNVVFYGNVLPYDDLEACLDQVQFVHLKDKLGANDEWNFPAIGDGNLDFEKIFHILKRGNYKGPISVEIEFTPSGPKNLEEVDDVVHRSYRYLESLLK